MSGLDSKVEIVFNPIVFSDKKAVKPNRDKYNLKKEDKVFLFLGRLSFIKGLDRLVGAFAHLVYKDPSCKLVIAGPDEGEKEKLDKQITKMGISKNVIFTGYIEGSQKEELFACSDVFVLFSYYEAFSVVVLEAISHSLPVCVAKDVGVAGEIERFQCAKILTDIKDDKKCASELEWVYDNRGRLIKNCKSALSQFDQSKIINQIVGLYRQVLKLP